MENVQTPHCQHPRIKPAFLKRKGFGFVNVLLLILTKAAAIGKEEKKDEELKRHLESDLVRSGGVIGASEHKFQKQILF